MEQTGEISPTDARAAARAMSLNDPSNPFVQEALKREAKERGWPTLVAYVLGPGIRPVSEQDQLIDQAWAEQSEMYAQRETMTEEQWSAAWDAWHAKYPFMRTLSLARKDREMADDAWVYDVMARLEPGQKISTAEEFGIPSDLMSRFYEEKGTSKFTPSEKMRLMAGILEMAQKYEVPTPEMTAEWTEVSNRLDAMNRAARERWPDIDAISDGYYAAKEAGQGGVYLEEHPELKQYWDWRDAYREADPVLRFHTNKDPRQEAIRAIWDAFKARSSMEKRAIKEALGRSFGAFLNQNYDSVRDEELYSWVTYLGAA
jgi:hypothetical protein